MKFHFFIIATLFTWLTTFGQVGIGIENPTELLEVDGGDVYIKENLYMNSIHSYKGDENGFQVIAADPKSSFYGELLNGELIEFTDNQEILPIIIQPYEIKNIRYHKMNNLNLNIPTDKYVISLSNFEALPGAGNQGLYRVSRSISNTFTYSNFVIKTFAENGNWHVQINAPNVPDNNTNSNWTYTYKFDIVVFPIRFFRDLGEVEYDLKGNRNGQAANPPNGL